MIKTNHSYKKVTLNNLGVPISWVGQSLRGISQEGPTELARLMEFQIWHPSADLWLCGRRARKRDSGLCPPFCLGVSCLPALAFMPTFQFLPACHQCLTSYYIGAGAQRE